MENKDKCEFEDIETKTEDVEMQSEVEVNTKEQDIEADNNTEDDKNDNDEISSYDIQIKKMQDQLAEMNDVILRKAAEFDNYRKRTDKEKQSMFDLGAKSMAEKLLPVIDNFERGLAISVNNKEVESFLSGMEMIYKQMMKNLEDNGVKPIDCLGKEFNPDFHNAVMHVEDENYGENIICEELQKGYMYKDSVLRYSMVKVAN